jgi:hypothetical protein
MYSFFFYPDERSACHGRGVVCDAYAGEREIKRESVCVHESHARRERKKERGTKEKEKRKKKKYIDSPIVAGFSFFSVMSFRHASSRPRNHHRRQRKILPGQPRNRHGSKQASKASKQADKIQTRKIPSRMMLPVLFTQFP